ncbi:MAG: uridine kinase, partial [Erysipelotrichaceae bacterium]
MKTVLIGIAGGSASGKTSIAKKVMKIFAEHNVVIIREDDYYKDQSHMEFEERIKTNYDHPFAFDTDLMIKQIDQLIDGQSIKKPVYDFSKHTRSNEIELIHPANVIIIEGLFVLEHPELRDRLNIKIFVDTPSDIRFIRRLIRDVNERDRSLDSVVTQYTQTVRVMHEQFIEPTKKYADLIIPEGGQNHVAIDLLCTKISRIIEENMI